MKSRNPSAPLIFANKAVANPAQAGRPRLRVPVGNTVRIPLLACAARPNPLQPRLQRLGSVKGFRRAAQAFHK